MVTTLQLEPFYPDLSDPRFVSRLALVHSRYSTNTFPSWPLAQPFRMIAHNGEINTVQGNRNWMRARQSQLESELLGDLSPLLPIVTPGGSDSASFDEVVELLSLSGRSLPHAVMMMVPEAWENQDDLDAERRAFYEYHSMLMEPWDGPAAIVFTDGSLVGATLDRNGLRPGRYLITDDGLVVLASEIGVLDIDPARVVRKGRLRPGKMFLVDTVAGRLIEDDEIKSELAASEPWGDWLGEGRINLKDLPEREHIVHPPASVVRRQRTFGYTEEEVRILLDPMARTGAEPLGAMGTDVPDRRAQRTPTAALRLLHPAVRPGHQPAAGLHPRRGGHLAPARPRPRTQPAFRRAGARPAGRARLPGHRQRRTGQDPAHRRACRAAARRRRSAASTASTTAPTRWRRGSRRCASRSTRPSRPARTTSCSPTATRTRTSRRSRRC